MTDGGDEDRDRQVRARLEALYGESLGDTTPAPAPPTEASAPPAGVVPPTDPAPPGAGSGGDTAPRRYYVPAPPVDPSRPERTLVAPSPPAATPPPASRPPGTAPPRPSAPAPGAFRRQPGGVPPVSPEARSRRGRSGTPWIVRALRPKWRWLFLYLPLLLLLALIGSALWVYANFNGLERVDLGDALAAPQGGVVNYLLVGSDSREGITEDTPNVGAIGTDVTGRRADTIIVLRIDGSRASMMSIPRDLWVTDAKTHERGRVNAAYNDGPANLVRTVTLNLGIPIHHYVEVGFVSFADMVDAIGGVTVDFPHPAFDSRSGLRIEEAGPRVLDGPTALAYVRSRHYTEVIDGKSVEDPLSDIGRQQRQQNFIRTVLSDVGNTRNPITLARVAAAAGDGVRVDTELGIGDAWSLARNLSGADPVTEVLPTDRATKGGADVLVIDSEDAGEVLGRFGGRPNAPS